MELQSLFISPTLCRGGHAPPPPGARRTLGQSVRWDGEVLVCLLALGTEGRVSSGIPGWEAQLDAQ